jgi:hypothetical protein
MIIENPAYRVVRESSASEATISYVCSLQPDAQWISSLECPLVKSAGDRQLRIKLTHDDSRLLDTIRACKVAK